MNGADANPKHSRIRLGGEGLGNPGGQDKPYLVLQMLAGFFAFVIINAPSIKLLYFSELVNIGAVLGLWGTGLLKFLVFSDGRLYFSRGKIVFLLLFSVLWVFLLFYAALGPYALVDLKTILQYLGVYGAVAGILLVFTTAAEVKTALLLQIVWAVTLASFQLSGMELIGSERQHYLTIGVPLAAGLVTLFGTFLSARSRLAKLISVPPAIAVVMALTTLLGRSPILFSAATIVLFWILIAATRDKLADKVKQFLLLAGIGAIVFTVIANNVTDHWLMRFQGLEHVEEEPRIEIYTRAFELIAANPLGYGLNASELLIGIYPHNLFLEAIISGGIGSFAALALLMAAFGVIVLRGLRLQSYLLPCCMLAFYFILTWNVSFELTSAFTPIGACALSFAAYETMIRRPGDAKNEWIGRRRPSDPGGTGTAVQPAARI